MRNRLLTALLLLSLLSITWPGWLTVAHADGPPTVHEVASELMCQCGCGLTVAACQESMACTVAAGLVQQIQRQIDAGKSKEEIHEYFVSVYGEQILALPRKSGFSLTAWTAPFLTVAAGAVAVSALAWLWARRRSAAPAAETSADSAGILSLYEERVDQDLSLME